MGHTEKVNDMKKQANLGKPSFNMTKRQAKRQRFNKFLKIKKEKKVQGNWKKNKKKRFKEICRFTIKTIPKDGKKI